MYNCIDIRLWNIRVQAIKENNSTSTFTKVMIPLLYHRRRLHLCEYTYHKYRIKNVALHTEFHFRCILLIPFFSYFLRLIFHGSKNICWIKKIRMLHIYIQVRHVPYGARPGFKVCLIMTHTIVSSISIDATSFIYFPTQTSLHERNILEKEGNQLFRMQRTNSNLAFVG